MDQKDIWNKRYSDAGTAFLFGTAPNRFLARREGLLQSGHSAVSIADGEGRNSVWLAELGLAEADHDAVVDAAMKGSSMKGNPITLTRDELLQILRDSA